MNGTLFDTDPPWMKAKQDAIAHNGTKTSIAAAEAIKPSAETLREQVYEFIHGCGSDGATREEIETGTGIGGSTVRPRVDELMKAERVKGNGTTRMTKAGRAAEVLLTSERNK